MIVPPSQSIKPPQGAGYGGTQGSGGDPYFVAGTPRGATQELFDARDAAPSRYEITPPKASNSEESLPPPGWGPRGSTTSWSIASGQSPAPFIPPPKAKKRGLGTKVLSELQGYLKVIAILGVVAVGLVIFLQSRSNSADIKITIFAPPEGTVSGSLVVKDSNGTELGKKQVSESGARCSTYRRVDLALRAKKSTEYVFEWGGVTANSLADSELSSSDYAIVLDIRTGTPYVTAGAPSQVC